MTAHDAARSAEPELRRRRWSAPTTSGSRRSTSSTTRPKGSGKARGYFVHPAEPRGKLPGVLVIHENRGLNPHIEDVARRLALDGFVAFAPDALFPLGGYPGDEDKARELFPKLDQAKTREDFIAAAAFLKARPECTGKIGAVGLLLRGGMVNYLATRLGSDLSAGRELLRLRPGHGGRAEDQGTADGALGGEGRAHQRQLAGVRDGRSRLRTSSTSASCIPARSTASTTTRRRGTTRTRPSSPGEGRLRSSRSTCDSLRKRHDAGLAVAGVFAELHRGARARLVARQSPRRDRGDRGARTHRRGRGCVRREPCRQGSGRRARHAPSTARRRRGFRATVGGCGTGNSAGASGCAGSAGTEALPPYCLGHIGYAVVPWKQRRGYADAVRSASCWPNASGLRVFASSSSPPTRTTWPHGGSSRPTGGVLVEEFRHAPFLGAQRKIRHRVQLP